MRRARISAPLFIAFIASGALACSDLLGVPDEPLAETPDGGGADANAIDSAIPVHDAGLDATISDSSDSSDSAVDGAHDATFDTAPEAATDADNDAYESGADGNGDATMLDASDGASDAYADADAEAEADPPDPLAICDSQVEADWRANPPAMGLANTATEAAYDPIIRALMKANNIPGGAVSVMRQGKLVFAKGYGFSNVEQLELAHPDTMFRIASLSKPITSMAIMMLVQAGKLSLDDLAFTILSNIQPLQGRSIDPALASITVRNLLQHTGGWNASLEGDPMFEPAVIGAATGVNPPDCNAIIQFQLSQAPTYRSGTMVDYSNFGYCVLGAVIEKVTGGKYADWVAANIIGPSEAWGRVIQGSTMVRADGEATYYDYPGAPLLPSIYAAIPGLVHAQYGSFYLEGMPADGAWVADPISLLRVQSALDGVGAIPALLNANSLATMAVNPNLTTVNGDGTTSPPNANYWYGLGWSQNIWGNWWHYGQLPGTTAFQMRGTYKVNGVDVKPGWAVLFNSKPQDGGTFLSAVDQKMWDAWSAVGDPNFTTEDYFDQYAAPFSPWESASDYATRFAQNQSANNWPVRVEGRLYFNAPQFRARFAHASRGYWSVNGVDCPTYQAKATYFANYGSSITSIQTYLDGDGHRRYQATWRDPQ